MTVAKRVSARLKEWGLREVDGRPQRTAKNGEPYVTLCSGGLKTEPMSVREWFESREDATESYLTFLDMYVRSTVRQPKKAKLHWRQRPAIDRFKGKYSVYSRLLASED